MRCRTVRATRVLARRGGAVVLAALLLGCAPAAEQSATAPPATATTVATPSAVAPTPTPSAPPASITLPGLDTPAPVTLAPVGADGSLRVPEDVSELGWWLGSAPMGATAGTTLVAGHVDSAEQGLGVFARLAEVAPGDELTVVDGLGAEHRFVVSGNQQVGKAALPVELFDTTGPRRLALVTCTGDFDEQARSYADNLVVWAEPA